MSGFDVQSVVAEALVAEAPTTALTTTVGEVVVAQQPAVDSILLSTTLLTEVLCADRPDTRVALVNEEVTVAQEPARDIPLSTFMVMREVLAFEGIELVQSVGREVALSLPDDPLTVHGLWTHFSSAALQRREYLFPPLYISEESVGTYAQQVTQSKPLVLLWSPTRVTRLAQLAARSRTRGFTPSGASRVPQLRMLAARAQPRPRPIGFPQVRSATLLTTVSYLRPIPPTANWVGQAQQLAAQGRLYGLPESTRDVGKAVQLAAALRVTEPPFTQALVAQQAQLTAAASSPEIPQSPLSAAQASTLAAQVRTPTPPYGPPLVTQHAQLAAAGLDLLMLESPRDVPQAAQLASTQILLPPPSAVTGVNYAAGRQLAAGYRATPLAGDVRSPLYAAQAAVQYALGRDTVPPDQVENPEIGCHVRQFTRMNAQFRLYPEPPPPEGGAIRVRQVAAGAVLRDRTFPAPPFPPEEVFATVSLLWQNAIVADPEFLPQSYLQVPAIEQRVTLGDADGWVDPTEPQSDVRLWQLDGEVVLGDTSLPDAGVAQSSARVAQLAQSVAMSDTSLPDAGVPLTDVRVFSGTEWVVFSDMSLPVGPQSVAIVGQVGQHCVLRDPSAVGLGAVSQILCSVIAAQVLLRDASLTRPVGRKTRPTAAIAMR